jgi:hypothetical protein
MDTGLKLILFICPFIVLFIILFPFFAFFLFVPVVLRGGLLGGRVGLAPLIGVYFHGGGGTNTFIDEDTIDIVTLDTGHFASS